MWVEGYARSLLGEPEPWAVFGRDTVSDWLDLLAERQVPDPGTPGPDALGAAVERTLLLAVLRGALLDLLAPATPPASPPPLPATCTPSAAPPRPATRGTGPLWVKSIKGLFRAFAG